MMSKFSRAFAVAWFTVATATIAQQPGDMRVKLIDDQTGFVIPPAAAKLNVAATAEAAAGGPVLRISSADRVQPLQVTADGYRPMTVVAPNVPVVEVRLSPLQSPPELAEARLEALKADGGIAVVGFVSDTATGAALSGVTVTAGAPIAASNVTNARGFFTLTAPRPPGYSTETGVLVELRFEKAAYQTLIRKQARITAESVRKYRVSLKPGGGVIVVDESQRQRGQAQQQEARPGPIAAAPATAGQPSSPLLPVNIRVGRNCGNSATACTTVEIVALDVYVKHVLPNEWIASWAAESLKAGSVAVRSYGVWNAAHPRSSTYDLCDNTFCQMYDPDVSDQATDSAVDGTTKKVLVAKGTNTVWNAEYSAENNHVPPCTDGQTGNGTSSPCVADSVCTGQSANGHGRGMCQKGSNRWAKGTNANGTPTPGGPRPMAWILDHYYTSSDVITGR